MTWVGLDGRSSQDSCVKAVSPQDSFLGLTLFLQYINNLPNGICDIANISDFSNLISNFPYNSVIMLCIVDVILYSRYDRTSVFLAIARICF